MVFKTITDDITGANKSIGLFGLSLKDVDNILYDIQTRGLKETLFNTSIIDRKAIDLYNNEILKGVAAQDALAFASKNTNKETIALMESANGAEVGIEALTAAEQASTIKAKALSAAYKGVSVAANMIVFALITKGIQLAAQAIDQYVNRAKYAAEAMEEAQQKIDDSQNSLKSLSTTLKDNKDRFLELSQGVNQFSKNLSLSEEDYAEYLSISQKLADISPSLISGYDDQGNALLNIGKNAEETAEKLNEVLEVQQAIAKQTLVDNLDAVAEGVYYEVEQAKNSISELQNQLNLTSKELNDLSFNFADIFENNAGIFKFTPSNDPFGKYKETLIKSLESAKISWSDLGNGQVLIDGFTDAMNNGGKDVYEVIDIALQEAQEYYNAMLNLDNNVRAASIVGLQKDIEETEKSIKASYSKMTANLQAWTEQNSNYQYLSDATQKIIDALIPEIDWDSLGTKFFTGKDYQEYINKNILMPLMSIKPNDKAEIDKMFAELLSFDEGNLDILPFARQLQTKLNELGITIDITPIIANEQEAKNKLQNSIENIAEGSDYYTSLGNQVDAQELKLLQEQTEGFTESQIELWLKATQGAKNAEDAINRYEEALKSADEAISENPLSISQTVDELNTKLKPAMDSLKSAWQDIFTDDGFTLENVGVDMLDSIKSQIDELNEIDGISIDYSSFEELARVLTDTSSTADDVKKQFNELANTIVYATGTAEVNSDTFDVLVKSMEEMGLVNAREVLTEMIELEKEFQAVSEDLGLTIQDVTNATYEETVQMLIEAQAAGKDTAALFQLAVAKGNITDGTISTESNVEALIAEAQAAGLDMAVLTALENVRNGNIKDSNAAAAIMENARQKILDTMSGFTLDFNFDGVGGGKKSAGKSGKEAGDEYVSQFEDALQELDRLRDEGKITEKEYLDQLRVDINALFYSNVE